MDPRETFFNRKSAKEVAVSPWPGAAIGAESGDVLGAQSGVGTGAGGGRAKLCGEAAIWSFFNGGRKCVPFSTMMCLLKIKSMIPFALYQKCTQYIVILIYL